MDEPDENRSESVTNLNCADDQITNSSEKRLRCIAQILAQLRNSNAKSRSDTLSNEFAVGRSKPRSFAVMSRSIGKDVPARAAVPNGLSFIRFRASLKRDLSLANIST